MRARDFLADVREAVYSLGGSMPIDVVVRRPDGTERAVKAVRKRGGRTARSIIIEEEGRAI